VVVRDTSRLSLRCRSVDQFIAINEREVTVFRFDRRDQRADNSAVVVVYCCTYPRCICNGVCPRFCIFSLAYLMLAVLHPSLCKDG